MTQRKSSKLGIIVRSDLGSGLQSQTLNLTRMLKPDRILHINSKPFNGAEPHYEMYDGFEGFSSNGFPDANTIKKFMKGLTHVLTAETFYGYGVIQWGNMKGIKTFNQVNYEFCDHLNAPLPMPYLWLMPSYWHLEDFTAKFENVKYLPPPIFTSDFKKARETNFNRRGYRRFVHIVGKQATHDRNGTEDVLEALRYCEEDFELVIRSQYDLPYQIMDRRVTFDIGNKKEQNELYEDYDAMILPRRYGGLCLPMNEALCSGLPVIMTDISPNNKILPEFWLAQAKIEKQFVARVPIDVYKSDIKDLAKKIDYFAKIDDDKLNSEKIRAFDIGFENYDADNLRDKYIEYLEL